MTPRHNVCNCKPSPSVASLRAARRSPLACESDSWPLIRRNRKWADPETRSLVDAVTSALENCDRKLQEANPSDSGAAAPDPVATRAHAVFGQPGDDQRVVDEVTEARKAAVLLEGLRPFLLHRVTVAIVDGLAEYARLEGQPDE